MVVQINMVIFVNNIIQIMMTLQGNKSQGEQGLFDERFTIERLSARGNPLMNFQDHLNFI
jgi:hypothetical protein